MNFSNISSHSLFGKILRLLLNLIPTGTVVPILQGPCRWKKWIVGSATHGIWLGSYEHKKYRLFTQSIQPNFTVYDIGANVGAYTLAASLRTPVGHVFSFEPFPRNLEYLKAHVKLNRLTNVTIVPKALDKKSGTAYFKSGSAHETGMIDKEGDLKVSTITLDSFYAKTGNPPNIIKMDVEGAEANVLRGGNKILKKYKPIIFLATHGPKVHSECCQILTSLGYHLKSLNQKPLENTDELLAVSNTQMDSPAWPTLFSKAFTNT